MKSAKITDASSCAAPTTTKSRLSPNGRGSGAGDEAIAEMLQSAMLIKPERHHLQLGEAASRVRAFSVVGGEESV
ncbi:MAG: hypothetical protein ACYDBO_01510 [Vulcanimicrobiaceae bacterium]